MPAHAPQPTFAPMASNGSVGWKAGIRRGAKINKTASESDRAAGAPYPTAVPLPPASVAW
jgi:hypothetical protein